MGPASRPHHPRGSLVFNSGGGGVDSAPKIAGGGVEKRAQLTGPLISCYELLKKKLSIEMVKKFFTKKIPGK